MSVKSSQPQSNLDTWAYVLNIAVIIIAIVSMFISTYFLQRMDIYSYYITPAISLLLSTLVCLFFAVNGIFFFIKVYGKAKKAIPILIFFGIILIITGLVFVVLSFDWVLITNSIDENPINNLQGLIISGFLIYLGVLLLFRSLAAKGKKKAW